MPDEFFTADPGLHFCWEGRQGLGVIGIVFGLVAPAETFFHVDGFGAGDVCAARGFPAVVIL